MRAIDGTVLMEVGNIRKLGKKGEPDRFGVLGESKDAALGFQTMAHPCLAERPFCFTQKSILVVTIYLVGFNIWADLPKILFPQIKNTVNDIQC